MVKALVILPGSLVDGTGHPPLPRPAVIVRDGVIDYVGPVAQVADLEGAGFDILEVPDLCLLPGMIDTHVHLVFSAGEDPVADLLHDDDDALILRATHNAQLAVCAGITTVRDCGGPRQTVLSLRNAVRAGVIVGPRIVAAGMPITTTGGHLHWMGLEADTADELRKAARCLVRQGVDFFKIVATGGGLTPGTNTRAAQYSVEELSAVVSEARRLGKKVAAHVHATAGIRNAVAADVDTLEHCSWHGCDGGLDYDEEVANEIVARGVSIGATLEPGYYYSLQSRSGLDSKAAEELATWEQVLENYRKLLRLGANFLIGTDAGCPHVPLDSLPSDIMMMEKELGISPLAGIGTVTKKAATALDIGAEVGTVECGKRADLILVEGDPSVDLSALRRVRWVLKDGVVVARNGRLVVKPAVCGQEEALV